MTRAVALVLALALWVGWTACEQPLANTDGGPSNGHISLCDRPYDQVSYLTTHNAMANEEDGWVGPNQLRSMDAQLADGVRGFMLDTYLEAGEALLCHSFCYFGSETLTDGLSRFTRFLDDHPREVITLILEAYAPTEQTMAAFENSGLEAYAYAHSPGEPWPTLGELVATNRRLVVFSDQGGGAPWHHPVWDHCWETHWHWEQSVMMSCEPNRGDPDHPLFILNHFITDPVASVDDAEEVNQEGFLWERASRCQEEGGQIPNFVTVDFYSVGDALQVVDRLNGVSPL